MKKIIILAIAVVFGMALASAGNPKQKVVNPRGIFSLKKISYENGRAAVDNPEQIYWFNSDSTSLRMKVRRVFNGNPTIEMSDVLGGPLKFTGYQKKSKSIQMYDASDDSFTLRWYNTDVRDDSLYPFNAYVVENYSRDNIDPGVAKSLEMLQMKIDSTDNRFAGVWKRRGMQLDQLAGTTDKVYGVAAMYKIYSGDKVMVVYDISDVSGGERAVCEMADVKYYDKNTLKEEFVKDGNSCIIFWINNDTFTLTFVRQGSPVTEVWDRSGLPRAFQDIFGTNVPITDKTPSDLTE